MGLRIVAGLVAFTAGDLAAKAAGRGAWHRRDEMGHAGRAHPFRNPVDDTAPMTDPADHRITFVKGSVAGKRYIADKTIVWTCGADRGARSRRRGRPPADGVILVMRYPGHSPSCPTRLAHTDRDRHPIRMQSWPAHVEQPPRDDRGIEIGCWRWAVGEPMPGFRLVPAACAAPIG